MSCRVSAHTASVALAVQAWHLEAFMTWLPPNGYVISPYFPAALYLLVTPLVLTMQCQLPVTSYPSRFPYQYDTRSKWRRLVRRPGSGAYSPSQTKSRTRKGETGGLVMAVPLGFLSKATEI